MLAVEVSVVSRGYGKVAATAQSRGDLSLKVAGRISRTRRRHETITAVKPSAATRSHSSYVSRCTDTVSSNCFARFTLAKC